MKVKLRIKKTALTIPNRNGKLMYAVVTEPLEVAPKEKMVIFCHPGPNNKAEAGDFLRHLGNNLTHNGYRVLRFDQTCTGESQGEIIEALVMDEFYHRMQTGMSANDTQDIINWVNKEFSGTEVYLLGYCAGCHSALLASQKNLERIAGFIFIAVPVIYSFPQGQKEEFRQFETIVIRREYMRKLFQPASYLRLMNGKSDLGLMKDTLMHSIRNFLKNKVAVKSTSKGIPDHPRFNTGFWNAFQNVVNERKKILFLMAEFDNETPDFNTEFKDKVLDKDPGRYTCCSIKYLLKSDHALMFEEPRKEAVNTITEWLNND